MHAIVIDQPVAPPRSAGPPLDIARLVHPSDWDRLPASLRRRFQVGHGPACYRGDLACSSSMIGVVFAWLARAFGGPLTGRTTYAATVTVRAAGPGVIWARQLGQSRFIQSVKSAGPAGTVIERTEGGLGMVLDVSVEAGALVFTSRSFFLAIASWRVPIPPMLTPGRCRVEHRAIDDTRFRFTLSMTHPLWGETFRQTGIFTDHQGTQS